MRNDLGLGDHFKTSADYIINKYKPKNTGLAVDMEVTMEYYLSIFKTMECKS